MAKVFLLVNKGYTQGHGERNPYTALACKGDYDTDHYPAFSSIEDAQAYQRMFDLDFEIKEMSVFEFLK